MLHETIRAHRLHERGVDGHGVGIAVIDTGVTPVSALRGRVRAGVDLSGSGTTDDAYGHGTAVAGLAAGGLIGNRPVGVAPGAHIVPIRVAGPDGATDVSNLLAAIQWAVSFADEHDIRIVTLSPGTDADTSWRRDLLNRAVQRAWASGHVVVTSAGNRGPQRGTVAKPADDPWALSVGAADTRGTVEPGDDRIASFTSRGPVPDGAEPKPDVLAPGVDVTTLRAPGSFVDRSYPGAAIDHQRVRASGTALAAATVAGAAALLLQENPRRTPEDVRRALLSTAARRPLVEAGIVGRGIVDVDAAVLAESVEDVSRPGPDLRAPLEPLGRTRGSVRVAIGSADGPTVLDGRSELTAQGETFDAGAYLADAWSDRGWSSSQWAAHEWSTPRWYGRALDQEWYAVGWG